MVFQIIKPVEDTPSSIKYPFFNNNHIHPHDIERNSVPPVILESHSKKLIVILSIVP